MSASGRDRGSRQGNKDLNTKEPTTEYDIQKCQFDEQIQIDTQGAFKAAKKMKDLVKDILRKQTREVSKHLSSFKARYQENLKNLTEYIEEISSALEHGRSPIKRSKRTASEVKIRSPLVNKTNETQTDKECMRCISKDKKLEALGRQIKQNEEYTKEAFATVDKCGEEIRRLKASNDKLEDQIRRLEEQTAVLKQQLQSEKDMKEDSLRRLSAMASSKLRDNNPNITDLSDQNRPTKIAEKLSELYDNQWTDAFDALQKDGKQDETIIQELLKMLMDIFNECSKLAKDNFFEKVQSSIEFPVQRMVHDQKVELPDQLKQQVKEFRRVRAAKVLRNIQEVVLENLGLVNQPKDIQSYLAHCVEIGWLAAVQDPPLALCGKSPDRFDTNVFKDYTQRGPYVEYVVWPALLLHENGPMLAKGVAQGCSVKPMSSHQNLNPNLPAKRQNLDASDGGSSTPKKAAVGPRERQTGNDAQYSKTISASGKHITKLYTGGSNPTPKESDF